MTLHRLFYLILFLCLIGGCTDRNSNLPLSTENDMTIHASLEGFLPDMQTRTEIGGIQEDGSIIMNWGVGDAMGIFTANQANVKFTNTNTVPSPNAEFKPETATEISGTPQYGYYPYTLENTDPRAIKVNIPEKQEYTDAGSIARYDVKAATITPGTGNSHNMKMHQLACLVRFDINIGDVKTLVENIGDQGDLAQIGINTQHIQRVNIWTNDKVNLTGNYTYDLTDLSQGLKPVPDDSQAGDLTVQLPAKPLLTSAEKLEFYAIVAPGNHMNKKLTCEISTEKLAIQFTTTIQCDFKAGSYYTVPVNSTVIGNADKGYTSVVTTPDQLPVPPEEEETANCYMINTTGAHEFWGTQIGNGAEGLFDEVTGEPLFEIDYPYIFPQSAKLVWQDVENFVSDISFNPETGKVKYTANKTTGNAVIAVYEGPDGTGDILWSWHIWGVGNKMPEFVAVNNMAGEQFLMMDRTLGAHSNESLNATLYQWGRKDPIPNSKVMYDAQGNAVDILNSYPLLKDPTLGIADGILHPDKMLVHDYSSWEAGNICTLWGDEYKGRPGVNEGGFKSKKAGKGWKYGKTIFDPSPVGYRVANGFAFTGFISNEKDDRSASASTNNQSAIQNLNQINCVKTPSDVPGQYPTVKYHDGYYFKANSLDDTGIFFPMCGFRNASNGAITSNNVYNVGSIGYYWTSFAQKGDQERARNMFIDSFVGWKNGGPKSANGLNTVYEFSWRGNACAIRCVKCETRQ